MSNRRRLVVMRHAKAEPYAADDQARELTARGRADARAAGAYLAEVGVLPTYALVSTAARTRGTWAEVAAASGANAVVDYDEAAYGGGTDSVFAGLSSAPADAETVIFIGHNPTAGYLVQMLDDGTGDAAAMQAMLQGFPTAALAIFDVAGTWAELAPGEATMTHFQVGRG